MTLTGMQAVCWGPRGWQSWLHVLAVLLLVPCLNVFGGLAIAHTYLAATGQTTYEVVKGAKVCRNLLTAILLTAGHQRMHDRDFAAPAHESSDLPAGALLAGALQGIHRAAWVSLQRQGGQVTPLALVAGPFATGALQQGHR